MYTSIHIHIRTSIIRQTLGNANIHTYMHAYMHSHTCIRTCMHTRIHAYILNAYMLIAYIHTHACWNTCIRTHVDFLCMRAASQLLHSQRCGTRYTCQQRPVLELRGFTSQCVSAKPAVHTLVHDVSFVIANLLRFRTFHESNFVRCQDSQWRTSRKIQRADTWHIAPLCSFPAKLL